MVGVVSTSRVPLFTLCMLPVVLLGGQCGPRTHRHLVPCPSALDTLQTEAAQLWFLVVSYETLFVVVMVPTVALHLGSPGLPGYLDRC